MSVVVNAFLRSCGCSVICVLIVSGALGFMTHGFMSVSTSGSPRFTFYEFLDNAIRVQPCVPHAHKHCVARRTGHELVCMTARNKYIHML